MGAAYAVIFFDEGPGYILASETSARLENRADDTSTDIFGDTSFTLENTVGFVRGEMEIHQLEGFLRDPTIGMEQGEYFLCRRLEGRIELVSRRQGRDKVLHSLTPDYLGENLMWWMPSEQFVELKTSQRFSSEKAMEFIREWVGVNTKVLGEYDPGRLSMYSIDFNKIQRLEG